MCLRIPQRGTNPSSAYSGPLANKKSPLTRTNDSSPDLSNSASSVPPHGATRTAASATLLGRGFGGDKENALIKALTKNKDKKDKKDKDRMLHILYSVLCIIIVPVCDFICLCVIVMEIHLH